eukprot:scaffold607854_cov46-Prasinocladus_malaysianus.AAC.1
MHQSPTMRGSSPVGPHQSGSLQRQQSGQMMSSPTMGPPGFSGGRISPSLSQPFQQQMPVQMQVMGPGRASMSPQLSQQGHVSLQLTPSGVHDSPMQPQSASMPMVQGQGQGRSSPQLHNTSP